MPLTTKERAAFKHFAAKKNWPQKIAFGMGGQENGKDAKNEPTNRQLTAVAVDVIAGTLSPRLLSANPSKRR